MSSASAASAEEPAGVAEVARLLAQAQRVVVLTGAGISAESGIATFRDARVGYWSQFDPEVLASPQGFARDPGLVWRWYMERYRGLLNSVPNRGHQALAALQGALPQLTLATQNVDDLHERAGSRDVLHLHGSLTAFRCQRCKRPHHLSSDDPLAVTPPTCTTCGGLVRPAVVWFGELLPDAVMQAVWQATQSCDLFLVVGTSGVVMPAAALPALARSAGATVVEVNLTPSEVTGDAHHFLQGKAGDVLPALLAHMQT